MSVIMVIFALILAGIVSAARLPLGRLPEIEIPRVIVEAEMPGLPAADIRALLTVPLEDSLASARGLVRMASMSRDGRAVLSLDFAWGEKTARASSRVKDIIDAAYLALPEGASKPGVLSFDPEAEPLLIISLASKSGDLAFARYFAGHEAKARLRRVEGAGQVIVSGGVEREVAVSVDMRRAAARGLTVHDIARLVAAENNDVPAGAVREGRIESVAVVRGRATDPAGLAALVFQGPSGPFRLSDLAEVEERDAAIKSLFVVDGEERVCIELYRRSGADPVATARNARRVVKNMADEFGRDLAIDIVSDASLPIAASVRSLALDGAVGALVAAMVLLALLGDPRAATLVASTIPVSVAVTLAALRLLGRSLNGMSLGGMALAIGMISDNAVVVLDSLSRRCAGNAARPDSTAAAGATMVVLGGTLGSMATTAVVFVPIIFLPGALGAIFGDLALSVVIANISGWLIAVLALPAMYRLFWSPSRPQKKRKLETAYRQALARAMRKPGLVLCGAALLAVSGLALTLTRPVAFLPPDAATRLELRAVFPPGSDLLGMAPKAAALSAALKTLPGIRVVFGRSGAEADDLARLADLDREESSLVLACELATGCDLPAVRKSLLDTARELLPGINVSIDIPLDPAARLMGLADAATLAIRASSPADLASRADSVEEALRLASGTALRVIERLPGGASPRILVEPRRDESARLGLGIAAAASALRVATAGATVSSIRRGDGERPIVVFASGAGSADLSGSLSGLLAIPVAAGPDRIIPAAAMARFSTSSEPTALARLDRSDVLYLKAIPAIGRERELEKALASVLQETKFAVKTARTAFGMYGRAMSLSVILVLLLLYLTLGAQFESFGLPLAIMATIPLAMAGVGPVLLASGTGLDSGSILGLVVLFGVVVNNAILLHEAGCARRSSGAGPGVAAYAGASDRARPILVTSLTTIVALLPMCLPSTGATQRSMALTMVGGIVASTVLTMFVSPVVFAGPRAKAEA